MVVVSFLVGSVVVIMTTVDDRRQHSFNLMLEHLFSVISIEPLSAALLSHRLNTRGGVESWLVALKDC